MTDQRNRLDGTSRSARSIAPVAATGALPARVGALLACALLGASLAGCASSPTNDVLTPVANASSVGYPVDVLVATTRERASGQDDAFTSDRSRALNYEQYTISIPPTHRPGEIEYPGNGAPDPATSFEVTSARSLQEADFKSVIAHAHSHDVVVFVHGYNTNYPEALYRNAQLMHDAAPSEIGEQPVSVLFAWPSRGELTGYVADRESTTYSRDYLEKVLDEIASVPDVRNIDLIAHSMGNWLAVETLRQAKLRSRSPFLGKLRDVALIAPDIDVDVFRTQLDTIGRLKNPITVVLNKHDLALATSQRLAGNVSRVGNFLIDNQRAQDAIKRYDLRVVDLSDVKGGDSIGHSTFIKALPALTHVIQSPALAGDGAGSHVLVVDAAGEALTAPLRLGQALMGQ
jgi:esterase/lipase superfamily enzyme